MTIVKKLKAKITIKNRWARRAIIAGVMVCIFLSPASPLGPQKAAAAASPEMPDILASALIVLTLVMLACIRWRFKRNPA